MVGVARVRHPDLAFKVGTFAALPIRDASGRAPWPRTRSSIWTGTGAGQASRSWAGRSPPAAGCWSRSTPATSGRGRVGAARHDWWGTPVDLTFHFLDPVEVAADLTAAGFAVMGRTDREPWPDVEAPTRRGYLLARRT